jgi:hypothetical protein
MNALAWTAAAAAGWGLAALLLLATPAARTGMRAACLRSGLGGAAALGAGVSSLLPQAAE